MADRCFESTIVKALEHTWTKWHQTIDFQEMPGIFEAPARTACVDACACMCGPPGKLLQRFASKVDSLVKTFARQGFQEGEEAAWLRRAGVGDGWPAERRCTRGLGCFSWQCLVGGFPSPVCSLLLHITSHSFSPWQSGFSEMDAQEKLEEEPFNLPG